MATIIELILSFCIFILPWIFLNYNFNNRTSPNGYKNDWDKMNYDLTTGKTDTEVKVKFVSGEYDVKK